jgi:hypothetical protein
MAIKLVKAGAKAVYKGYDKVDEFSGIVDDAATVVSTQAGLGSRVLSALSLASEVLPVSAGDIKDGYRWVRGGDQVLDAAADARASQRAVRETASEVSSGSYSPKATTPYVRPSHATVPAQRRAVQGQPCATCGALEPKMYTDHKTPLVKEHYETGGIDRVKMRSVEVVQPQCPNCSNGQGGNLSKYGREMKGKLTK